MVPRSARRCVEILDEARDAAAEGNGDARVTLNFAKNPLSLYFSKGDLFMGKAVAATGAKDGKKGPRS